MPRVYGEVTVSWTRNSEADLAGYRIYYGPSSLSLPHSVDVGLTATPLTPTHTLTSFNIYGTIHFSVTAYDTSNNESDPSAPTVTMAVAPKIMPMVWP